jgi:pentatricopeptide repeat protein
VQLLRCRQVFAEMQQRGVEADVVTCCALISALERGGQWQMAERVFLRMCENGSPSNNFEANKSGHQLMAVIMKVLLCSAKLLWISHSKKYGDSRTMRVFLSMLNGCIILWEVQLVCAVKAPDLDWDGRCMHRESGCHVSNTIGFNFFLEGFALLGFGTALPWLLLFPNPPSHPHLGRLGR